MERTANIDVRRSVDVPGTVKLEDGKFSVLTFLFCINGEVALLTFMPYTALATAKHAADGLLILYPQPTDDPNDPLNWSHMRKIINFGIVTYYSLIVFAILAINPVVWQDYNALYGISYDQLNYTFAAQCIGMAVGCAVFIPFALKYGRKPVYIVSTFVVFLTAIWQACLRDLSNMIAANLVSGLFGAVGDTLVQMTVADIFFLHQRGTMNAIYVLCINIGSLLAPVAAGYSAHSQGWPWIFWWCAILLGINLLLFIFCYEETKYLVILGADPQPSLATMGTTDHAVSESKFPNDSEAVVNDRAIDLSLTKTQTGHPDISPLSYWQRMTRISITPGGFKAFIRHVYQPFFVLATFPAVAYTAILYGSLLSWYSVIAVTQTEFFSVGPYNFSTVGIGLLSLPAFIGCLFAAVYSGPFSDWSIQWFAKRNNNIYEPEMRLYIAILPVLLGPAGLWLYGYSLAKGAPWIVPCVGYGIFGFAQSSMFGLTLTYLIDSYEGIIGDTLVGVAVLRNGFPAGITFATAPWVNNLGLWNTFTSVGCLCLGVGLLTIPMIVWGKRLRAHCAGKYAAYADLQSDPRGRM